MMSLIKEELEATINALIQDIKFINEDLQFKAEKLKKQEEDNLHYNQLIAESTSIVSKLNSLIKETTDQEMIAYFEKKIEEEQHKIKIYTNGSRDKSALIEQSIINKKLVLIGKQYCLEEMQEQLSEINRSYK